MTRRLAALCLAALFVLAATPASACLPGHFTFTPGSTAVSANDRSIADDMVAAWRARPDIRWSLSPNDQSEDSPAVKVRRARLRGEAVREALISRGIPAASLEISDEAVADTATMSGTTGFGRVWVREIEPLPAGGQPWRGC